MANFSTFLNEKIGEIGLGTLSDKIEVDPAALSRFRSDQGNLSLKIIDRIFDSFEVVVISRAELRKREEALEVLSDLWKAERKKNLLSGSGTRKQEK